VRLVDPGNLIHANDARPIANLVLTQPSAVLFTLPMQVLNDLRDTMARSPVEVTAFDQNNRRLLSTGKLLLIDNAIDQATATIMMLWAHSDTLPLTIVHDYLDNIFIQALSQLPGVAQASIIGDQKPSIRVQVDPAKLAAIGLTLEEVRGNLVNATSNAAKGTIFTPKVGYTIATNDQLTDAEPFNDVILAYRNGAALRVRDVGQAVVEATSRYVAGYPGNKPGILLSIRKLPGANVIDTVELIKA
jgi:multidrug efflux pump subunit AcrB